MRKQFQAVKRLLNVHQQNGIRPQVVYTGDIFHDGWRERSVPPELINFLIREMPKGYAVPGQHDLPYHRYEDKHKSAYWTLVEANVLKDLVPGIITAPAFEVGYNAIFVGFPWGTKQTVCPEGYENLDLRIAVVHDYCWVEGHTYPNAPTDKHVRGHAGRLSGFTHALFGDNHKGFLYPAGAPGVPSVCNVGSFLKRNTDERDSLPSVCLIKKSGRVFHADLNGLDGEWLDVSTPDGKMTSTLKEFATKLNDIQAGFADLKTVAERIMEETKTTTAVHEEVLRILIQAKAKKGP